jgi:hypothetical protein
MHRLKPIFVSGCLFVCELQKIGVIFFIKTRLLFLCREKIKRPTTKKSKVSGCGCFRLAQGGTKG